MIVSVQSAGNDSQQNPPTTGHETEVQRLDRASQGMVTRAQTGIRKPNPKYALQVFTQLIPRNIKEAKGSSEWYKAMVSEMNALRKNETWKLIPRTPKHNVLSCKWVYKLKQDENGQISRHKARLVANGMRQVDGVDVHDTFAPVIKLTTIRVILAIATTNDWELGKLDVSNAFLHGVFKKMFLCYNHWDSTTSIIPITFAICRNLCTGSSSHHELGLKDSTTSC